MSAELNIPVAIACDHAGFTLKKVVMQTIKEAGYDVLDLGTYDTEAVDYPDYALKIGTVIAKGDAKRGVLMCGSGVGASIASNKIKGVYAGLCHDSYSAAQGVEHDNMNILCLGSRVIGEEIAKACVLAFLSADFSIDERHHRRVGKTLKIEESFFK